MPRISSVFKNALSHRLLKFCMIGGGATLIHAVIFLIIIWIGRSQIFANCIAYAFASIWSYVFNAWWTFGASLSWRGLVRFQMTNSVLLLSGIVIAILGEWLRCPPVVTLAVTVTVGPMLSYLCHSRITFREP